jgi:hypothetical protein
LAVFGLELRVKAAAGNQFPIADFKFYEVAKYITLFPFGGKMQLQLINKNSWAKLPADIQANKPENKGDIQSYDGKHIE